MTIHHNHIQAPTGAFLLLGGFWMPNDNCTRPGVYELWSPTSEHLRNLYVSLGTGMGVPIANGEVYRNKLWKAWE